MTLQPSLKISLAAGHVGEAVRLLRSVDREKFEYITRKLQPLIRKIEEAANQSNQGVQ
jgi:hypothetical protein